MLGCALALSAASLGAGLASEQSLGSRSACSSSLLDGSSTVGARSPSSLRMPAHMSNGKLKKCTGSCMLASCAHNRLPAQQIVCNIA